MGSGSGRVRAGLRPGGAPSLPAKGAKGQGRTRQAQTPLTGRGNRTLLAPDAGRAEPRGRSPGTDARRGAGSLLRRMGLLLERLRRPPGSAWCACADPAPFWWPGAEVILQ